jgi:hypothetical protein
MHCTHHVLQRIADALKLVRQMLYGMRDDTMQLACGSWTFQHERRHSRQHAHLTITHFHCAPSASALTYS